MSSQEKKAQNKIMKNDEIFANCSFSSLGLHETLSDQLKERLGFESPTQVQAQAIPVVLSGRHVMVNAATGTGKTIAYLAPIVHHLQDYNPRIQRADGTFALVLVPTRELCMQVYEILQKLLHRFHWIVPGYIMGGENRSKEKARLRKDTTSSYTPSRLCESALGLQISLTILSSRKSIIIQINECPVVPTYSSLSRMAAKTETTILKEGISILVATPGRLLDHLKKTSSFVHGKLRWIVFDEADRILELGFGKDIEEILDLLGSRKDGSGDGNTSGFQRQNLLLSATLNEKVNHLAQISLEDPVLLGLGVKTELPKLTEKSKTSKSGDNEDSVPLEKSLIPLSGDYNLPSQLVQTYVKVPCGSRLAILLSILKHLFEKEASYKVVLFFSTCDAVDFHYSLLSGFQWGPNGNQKETPKQKFLTCKTFRLHGNMQQEDRKKAFQTFKTEKSALLLSTDVSARGLDFPKVRCIIQYDSPGEATEYVHRVGRTARLDKRGDSILFLQPVEIDYLKDLEKHGVLLTEYPIRKVLDSFPVYDPKMNSKKSPFLDLHPWILSLQKALEAFVSSQASTNSLAKTAYCSWLRAYTAHRGDLKRIFMVKKLHLGHVAKSFALKEQPSMVVKSFQKQKRKRDQKQLGSAKKRKTGTSFRT